MSETKPVIFISYSHKDEADKPADGEQWLTYVQSHLQPAVKGDIFDLWTDHDIDGGADWRAAIDKKLNDCDIFILLVSRHSVSSDFICGVEVDLMLARRRKGDLAAYPIVLSPFAKSTVPWLMEMNLMPREGKPLSTFGSADRDSAMVEIVEEIAAKAKEIAEKKKAPSTKRPIRARTTDSAARFTGEVRGPYVDVTHLPETAYERLVGREAELKRLDDAWTDANTNILSLIAEGGAGKSALVNEWLKRLQADNYRGAEAVLGWSFYSQGTKERATSAEQFLNWALDKLGIKLETTSATAKGEAIAEAMAKRRVLLVLDGVEPLQHGLDKQHSELKDQGLRALIRRFAAMPPTETHGLVVLTSRLAVKDIARWKDGAAPVVDVEQLSDEAGEALLRDNGVWGTDKELKAASRDFGGHPLALGLLASFLKETQFGDVRRRDHIREFFADPENPRHDHAKRVMESYEKEWLAGRSVERAIMHLVGLFDRPASADCLRALRQKPTIPGLTDAIVDLDEGEWRRAVARLRDVRLLAPSDPSAPEALDAHPLVREWFGSRLEQTNKGAWRAAHGRLYEHLRDTTKEGKTPTLEDLAPLYQAIAHGCRAGRHQEALDKIYTDRICRRREPDGMIEFYTFHKLGAFGSDLAAISWFFNKPYEIPFAALGTANQSWLLGVAAFGLRAQGRFAEALPAIRAGLPMETEAKNWHNAAIAASNLSEAELVVGEVAAAVATAEQSVAHADRSGDTFEMMSKRVRYADALCAAGRREEAQRLFADAEQRQRKSQPTYPLLYSVQGYMFCDLLLALGKWATARDRATKAIVLARRAKWLLDIALNTLILGRAHLGLALKNVRQQSVAAARDNVRTALVQVDGTVDGLRAAAQTDDLQRGLLARAAFRRSVGDWDGATRDLDEVEETAKPGPMRLFLCDMALERARLAFARIEAFAPLRGMLDDNPPKPVAPDETEAARLKAEAAENVAAARKLITDCGYHRRDEELAELEAVLAGTRKFADLPPRV
jgi:tetratricopeptide (TPR) repeat protein